ncbi:uncharacterized protein G2W53_023440 [Senna tora]|uniref:Uncharacterized protein n=1 Tax=Senna tora TaxID=362788 RepID=A0A834WC81_9FABA|nr:uncharacterized protein G2W53_023440 [Senna tora]
MQKSTIVYQVTIELHGRCRRIDDVDLCLTAARTLAEPSKTQSTDN